MPEARTRRATRFPSRTSGSRRRARRRPHPRRRRPDRARRARRRRRRACTARVLHGGELNEPQGHEPARRAGVARRRSPRRTAPTSRSRSSRSSTTSRSASCAAPQDIAELRAMIPKAMLVVAKIEKDSALENIESIIRASDGVMVARGDLGVELPFEEVPLAQKRIIALANRLGRPVITATQMLESMIEQSAPDARRGERRRQRDPRRHRRGDALGRDGGGRSIRGSRSRRCAHHQRDRDSTRAVARATSARRAATVVVHRGWRSPPRRRPRCACSARRCVIVFTKSGFSARIVASHRPRRADPRAHRRAAHLPAARARVGRDPRARPALRRRTTRWCELALDAVRSRASSRATGDRVVVTAGVPFDVPGTTNLLKVETV